MIASPIDRLHGSPLLLLLDIDGTLCELMPHAGMARVPDATREVLERLAELPDVHVALVTGRAVDDATRIAPVRGAHIYGNHGIEWRDVHGRRGAHPAWTAAAGPLREAAERIPALLADAPGTWLEDKRYTLSVHTRGAARPAATNALERVRALATALELRTAEGKEVLNVLPPAEVHKGTAVKHLVETLAEGGRGSVLFAGDDVTDEDAFRVLRAERPDAVTIHVGDEHAETAAEFRVPSPAALADLLRNLERARS